MKRILPILLIMSLLLSGCTWLDGEYHSVTPHQIEGSPQIQDGITVSSYNELRDCLVNMVSAGTMEATLHIQNILPEDLGQYMNMAIMHVCHSNAIGAYAVQEITYEVGTVADYEAVAVDITYQHGRQEILRIKKVDDVTGLKSQIINALLNFTPGTVVKVDYYTQLDVVQFVQDYVDANPHTCMEQPQVSVMYYPQNGRERVVELSFQYQTSREVLREMQEMVAPIFSAAKMYVQGSEDDLQKYEQLYAFLMERFDYQIDTSNTPAYSLLRHGVGDSKAFASVYSVMCKNAGLTCHVVSGTHNGVSRFWNQVVIDGTSYHLDLLADREAGEFSIHTSEEMVGYVWDYSRYQ